MFERAHHQRLSAFLRFLDGPTLLKNHCLLGGGTAIVLARSLGQSTARLADWQAPEAPKRGWYKLYVDHVQQAHLGADLDFLVGGSGAPVPAQPTEPGQTAGYGAQFWLMNNIPGVPQDTFYAAGNRGQYIVVLPALNTVVVRQGYDSIGGARFDIDRFVLDITRAIQAADADRGIASEDLRRAAEAENAPRVSPRGN